MIRFKETMLSEESSIREMGRLRVTQSWPDWTKPKQDENANAFLILGQGSLGTSEINRNVNLLKRNTRAGTVDLWEPGSIYKYSIPSEVLFNYIEGQVNPTYITPSLVEGDSIVLKEAPYRSVYEFLSTLPADIRSTGSPYDYEEFLITTSNIIDDEFEFYIKDTNGKVCFEIEKESGWDFDLFNNILNNGDSEVKYFEIYNKQFPKIKGRVNVYREGSYSFQEKFPTGKYKIRTNLLGVNVTLNAWGISNSTSNNFEILVLGSTVNYCSFNLSLDASCIEATTYSTIESDYNAYPLIVKNYHLKNKDKEDVTCKSIACNESYPWIFGLSEDGETLYIWSLYERECPFILDSNESELISLHAETIDYKVGDTLSLKTRLNSWNRKIQIPKIRLKIIHEDGTSYYIDKNGNEVEDRIAWIDTAKDGKSWFDLMWDFFVDKSGFYKLEVESFILDSSEVLRIGQAIIEVPEKVALREFSLAEESELIGIGKDGFLYIKVGNSIHSVKFLYDSYYINYESYELFTRSSFDEVSLTI